MPVSERAKQFMPFAALKGLPEALTQIERAHTATSKKELSEEMAAVLNHNLLSLYPGQQATIYYYKAGYEQQIAGPRNRLHPLSSYYIKVSCSLPYAFYF